jgi:class 3 adenylate cyclase
MFTDLVDSTSIANRLGDVAWRDVLSSHFETARALLEKYAGREIKTTGDGMLATFDGTATALNCASELSRRAQHDGLHIRLGVHVGEVEAVGDDVRGMAVHEAGRIMGRARDDEVLVSETASVLAGAAGFAFEDRGMHELKGIGDTHLFALKLELRRTVEGAP